MTTLMRATVLFAALIAGAGASAQTASPPSPYPGQRTVKLVVPYSAGGSSDAVARFVASKLGAALATPVIVENRAGAAGMIGTAAVAQSAPDGLTLLFTIGAPFVMNPLVYPKLSYDPERDFAPVTQLATLTSFLVVPANFPARNIQEFVALGRSKNRRITFASFGTGTGGHVAGEYFNKLYGTAMEHVPYKGISEAVRDLVGGQVDCVFVDFTTAGALIKAGKLRALAAVSDTRSPVAPDVPTFAEAGFPGLEKLSKAWYGLLAPAKTPRPVLERLAAETTGIVRSREFADRLAEWGLEPTTVSLEAFAAQIRADRERNRGVVSAIGGVTLN